MINDYRDRLLAAFASVQARPLTASVAAAGAIMFLLLLGGSAGTAILVSLLVVPFVVLFYLTRLDLFEREPWALLAGVIGAGALVGLIGAFLSDLIFDRFWFTDSRLNLGAIGFSGISANGEGSVPIGVLLLGGIVVPVLTAAAALGGPILLRRWPVFRNEITDGMTLGALAAGGFATLSSFVYFWPSAFDDLPDRPVSQWTALLTGIVLVRPVVLILAGALLGIAAWQYASSRDIRPVLIAGVAGAFGWLALPLGSLVFAQSGAVPEFFWYVVVLVIVGVLFRSALQRGLAVDRQVLQPSDAEHRVVCPNCHRVTPDGSFCSFCRAPLHPESPVAPVATGPASTIATDRGNAEAPIAAPAGSAQPAHEEAVATAHPGNVAPATWTSSDADETQPDPLIQDRSFADAPDSSMESTTPWRAHSGLVTDAEPEADGFDHLDRSGSPENLPGAANADPTTHPFRNPSTGPVSTNSTARFRGAAGWSEPAASADVGADTSGPPAIDEREDQGLFPTDESVEPALPISIRDWSRRPLSDGSASAGRGETVTSGESAEPATENRPWPLTDSASAGNADGDIDSAAGQGSPTDETDRDRDLRPLDFGRVRLKSEGGTTSDEAVGQSSGEGSAPVVSSSGRWFDASTSQGGGSPGQSSGQADLSADGDRTGTVEAPGDEIIDAPSVSQVNGDPTEFALERTMTTAEPTSSGLRWYHQDEDSLESPQGTEDAAEIAETPVDQDEPVAPPLYSTEPVAEQEHTGSQEAASQQGRTGIWRSFGRPGRSGSGRTPQRDQGTTSTPDPLDRS